MRHWHWSHRWRRSHHYRRDHDRHGVDGDALVRHLAADLAAVRFPGHRGRRADALAWPAGPDLGPVAGFVGSATVPAGSASGLAFELAACSAALATGLGLAFELVGRSRQRFHRSNSNDDGVSDVS